MVHTDSSFRSLINVVVSRQIIQADFIPFIPYNCMGYPTTVIPHLARIFHLAGTPYSSDRATENNGHPICIQTALLVRILFLLCVHDGIQLEQTAKQGTVGYCGVQWFAISDYWIAAGNDSRFAKKWIQVDASTLVVQCRIVEMEYAPKLPRRRLILVGDIPWPRVPFPCVLYFGNDWPCLCCYRSERVDKVTLPEAVGKI